MTGERLPYPGTVVLVRHGETVGNRAGFILGQSDSPLTEEGIAVAEEMATVLAAHNIRTVYSSTVGRARASTDIYNKRIDAPVIHRAHLAELSCGEWEGKKRADFVPDPRFIRNTWTEQPPGGESYQDGELRITAFIRELQATRPEPPILVVGHASINRVFLKVWLALEPSVAMRILFPHNVAYVMNADHPVRHIRPGGLSGTGLLFADAR